MDIRTHILSRTYGQCLKLLHPEITGDEFSNLKRYFPDPPYTTYNSDQTGIATTDTEDRILTPDIRNMNEVIVSSINILSLGQHAQTIETDGTLKPPALILDFCAEEMIDPDDKTPNNMDKIGFMVVIRSVLGRARVRDLFLNTNPIKVNKIRESLAFLLDASYFRTFANQSGVVRNDQRPGYDIPSMIYRTYIMSTKNYGAVSDKYITDFLFVTEFFQQKERGEYAVQSD